MLRVPARKYSKVSNTRPSFPEFRVESPNTSKYVCTQSKSCRAKTYKQYLCKLNRVQVLLDTLTQKRKSLGLLA